MPAPAPNPTSTRKIPTAWLVAALGAAGAGGLAGTSAGGLGGLWASVSSLWADDHTRVYPRAELRSRVLGRSWAEAFAAVGPPAYTASSCFSDALHYERRTRDERTGRVDADLIVHLKQDRVVAVEVDGQVAGFEDPSAAMGKK